MSGMIMIAANGGTGRFEGAAIYGVLNCRWTSPEALMAGVEPELCVLRGTLRYDPFAGAGSRNDVTVQRD